MPVTMDIPTPDARSVSEATITPEGRLRHAVDDRERLAAIAMNLWWLALWLPVAPVAPAIPIGLWIWLKNRSRFADDHGREAINFALSQVILTIGLTITLIGVIAIPVLWVVGFVNMIRAAVAAGRGEFFRYPLTFRLL
ncbi:MAG: DUF4870 domain-containing protein [Phycisphaerales bacterium]